MTRRASLLLVLSIVLLACTTSPTGRRQLLLFPEEQMAVMGAQAFAETRQHVPTSSNRAANESVQCVTAHLLRALGENPSAWEVVTFDDAQLNAFALPGRKIGVYTGLFKAARNADQLAAVIGHEIGHVIAQHSNERVSTSALATTGMQIAQYKLGDPQDPKAQQLLGLLGLGVQFGVILPYSRTHESEADRIGLELMAKAGFNPNESVTLWQNMASLSAGSPPEFMSTHPSSSTRIRDLQTHMPQAMALYQASPTKAQCAAPAG